VFLKKKKIHDNGNENRIEGREGVKNRKTTVLSIYEIARFPFA